MLQDEQHEPWPPRATADLARRRRPSPAKHSDPLEGGGADPAWATSATLSPWAASATAPRAGVGWHKHFGSSTASVTVENSSLIQQGRKEPS